MPPRYAADRYAGPIRRIASRWPDAKAGQADGCLKCNKICRQSAIDSRKERTIDQDMSEARQVDIEAGLDTETKQSEPVAQSLQYTIAYSFGNIRFNKLGKTGSSV